MLVAILSKTKKPAILLAVTMFITLISAPITFGKETSAPYKWEIWATQLASVNIGNGPTSTSLFNTGNISVGYLVLENLEIMISPSIFSNGSTTSWSLMGGLNYSFLTKIEDAPFVQFQAGMGSSNSTGAQWQFSFGKRFKIIDQLTFSPALSYSYFAYSSPSNSLSSEFSILPIQFTALF